MVREQQPTVSYHPEGMGIQLVDIPPIIKRPSGLSSDLTGYLNSGKRRVPNPG